MTTDSSHKHAQCSPSGASGWLNCAGWDGGGGSSKFAREGTAAHELAAAALLEGKQPHDFIGDEIIVEGDTFTVDMDMADHVKVYTDTVRRTPGRLLVEQRLPVHLITGEPDAYGTGDAVILGDDTIYVKDLKYGMGVPVSAFENDQLRIYALAALEEYAFMGDFKFVSLWIIQPRIDYITDWTVSVDDLQQYRRQVYKAAQRKLSGGAKGELNPGEKQCRWCNKKATCTALASFVMNQITDDFVDLTKEEAKDKIAGAVDNLKNTDNEYLARFSDDVLSLIEIFVKGVRGRIEAEIFAGRPVKGWKLVQGRKGARAWADESVAESELKDTKLKDQDIYKKELISAPQAEKILKRLAPKKWEELNKKPGDGEPSAWEKLVTQSEGKPSVAPASDKRPALELTPVENDFDDETGEDLT